MAAIRIDHVTKTFGAFHAVRMLDLDIRDGELVALLGPSGCGKTTTMNIIAGFETPTEGRVLFDGRDVSALPPGARGVGFVFQNYAIFTHMTVRQNIAFGLRVRRTPRARMDAAVLATATLFGLERHLGEPARRLGVNQMQRLAIARSSIIDPSIFLLDEPLSNLDASFREEMRVELKSVQRRLKQTMVYVTHDQVEAMSMADTIVVMNEGEVQQCGSPEAVYRRPANIFVANFIGSPSMNLLQAEWRDGTLRLDLGTGECAAMDVPGNPPADGSGGAGLVLGIRPERVQLTATAADAAGLAFDIEVAHVERVGARTIVHGARGPHRVISVEPNGFRVTAGDRLTARLPLADCLLFDAASGAALTGSGR